MRFFALPSLLLIITFFVAGAEPRAENLLSKSKSDFFIENKGQWPDEVKYLDLIGCAGSQDFPTTSGAYDESFNGDIDAFVTKPELPAEITSGFKFTSLINNEDLCAGEDYAIKWEGVSADELILLEFTTDGGETWSLITDNASGLQYVWRVPDIDASNCQIRGGVNSETVTICSQVWMTKNLDVSHYRNGDSIPQVTDPNVWDTLTTGAWCYYDNDPANGEIYGKLYNWYAVNDPRGLAPEGWHVPTDEEWKELEMCLGMSQAEANNTSYRGTDEGSKLAGRADLWNDGVLENNAAFGGSGFSALPGGYRSYSGAFYDVGYGGYWWSSSEYSAASAWSRNLLYNSSEVCRYYYDKEFGFSVRCVRD